MGGAAAAPHVHVMLVDWGAGQAGCPAAWPNTSLDAAMKEVLRCEQITLHTWVGLAPSVDGLERKGGGFLEGKLDLKTATQRPCLRSLRAHLPHGFQICPTIVFLKVRRGGTSGIPPPQSRRPERPASHTCTLGDNRQSAWARSRAPPGRCWGTGRRETHRSRARRGHSGKEPGTRERPGRHPGDTRLSRATPCLPLTPRWTASGASVAPSRQLCDSAIFPDKSWQTEKGSGVPHNSVSLTDVLWGLRGEHTAAWGPASEPARQSQTHFARAACPPRITR